jgi:hypothetical protein
VFGEPNGAFSSFPPLDFGVLFLLGTVIDEGGNDGIVNANGVPTSFSLPVRPVLS